MGCWANTALGEPAYTAEPNTAENLGKNNNKKKQKNDVKHHILPAPDPKHGPKENTNTVTLLNCSTGL